MKKIIEVNEWIEEDGRLAVLRTKSGAEMARIAFGDWGAFYVIDGNLVDVDDKEIAKKAIEKHFGIERVSEHLER
jgi:hypothetical protein